MPSRSRPAPLLLDPPRCAAAACLVALGVLGCGGEEPVAFDQISQLPQREKLVEIDLGEYLIPIPVVLEHSIDRFEADNLIQLQFDLFAIVSPKDRPFVEQLISQREGRLRDEVIRVCRNTARDDILDSEWSTLKAHLLDATRPMLGGDIVRRIGVNDIQKEEL